ncbi:MAG: ABC transporter ATP-binding protein [Euzebyaceae bacterium]|nr:ABC transporter ATP-binding protein [Euzebyaceae bacterium]
MSGQSASGARRSGADAASSAEAPVVEARGVGKVFPGVTANAGVDLAVRRGEVHALLGENGAGKSTLASILCGLYQPDEGTVLVDGRPVTLRNPRDGLARGIGMVHQHFRLVERFTVAENIVLGDRRQPLVLSAGRVRSAMVELGERYGLSIDPDARVGDLAVGEQQRVEITKMLYRGVDVLLLDEPTAVLTPQEADALFTTLRAMAADGKAVVLISHKLGEVLAVADRVTVLRDGRVVGAVAADATDRHQLATMMVGREVDLSPRRAQSPPGVAVLDVRGVSLRPPGRPARLAGVSLQVHAGEVVGVAGVAGNGQRELAEVVAGLRAPTEGTVVVAGRGTTGRGARAARGAGLAYVPEDRLGTGLAPSLSIADNLLLTRPLGFFVDRRTATADARCVIERFDVKATGPAAAVRGLSGGNVQKVLLGRELSDSCTVLVVASPTRGLDVGAIEFVRDLLDERRRGGVGVLLLSEDLDEIRALADRILVLFEGRIVLERAGGDADLTELGLAMAGAGA